MFDTLADSRAGPRPWAAIVCASLFFLGSADHFFAIRVQGITLRLAQVVLFAALVVWWQTKRKDSREESRRLLIAWAPFLGLFLLAALLAADPLPGLLKLAWFGFNFLGAYAWCQLFKREDLVRGYFSAYLLVAAVIVFDFLIGFGAGPSHMVGYAQQTYGVRGHEGWFRPHAFYYEPSFAAAGLGLAWALALTPLYVHAPKTSAAVVLAGGAALVVTFSRTGWVYALITVLTVLAVGGQGLRMSLRRRIVYLSAFVIALLALVLIMVPEHSRGGAATVMRALGIGATVERVCPIVNEWFPPLGLRCLEGTERASALPFSAPGEPPERTSEGGRLKTLQSVLARIEAHPFVGQGVVRRADKIISPTVPNTWFEIAVEGGVLALIAFLWGLIATIYRLQGFRRENLTIGLALLLYFLVTWQFIQMFPRLDQWLSFWMALTVAHLTVNPLTQRVVLRSSRVINNAQDQIEGLSSSTARLCKDVRDKGVQAVRRLIAF